MPSKKNTYDIIAVGPSGIDTLVLMNDVNIHCSINKKSCELCLRYGDKILADGMETKTAYNGMNNAVGSARLGLKTAFYSVIGGDSNAERIMSVLKKEKVDTKYIQHEPKLRSNASVVINYKGERTIMVYHEIYKYKLPNFASTNWFYLTSLGKLWEPFYKQFAKHVKKSGAKLGFNPGTYQLNAGPKKLKPIFELTTALFLNREEARVMTGIKKEKTEKELLDGMRKLGAKIAVLTDGPKGSYASDGIEYLFQHTLEPTPVVERTGCGDSYATGFMAGLQHGGSLAEAMRWGTVNAAGVLGKIGPQDGLRTKDEMNKLLKKHKKLQPTSIK
jgi:ribokinase